MFPQMANPTRHRFHSCGVRRKVSVHRCAANPEIFRDVLGGMPIELHPACGGNVLGVVDLPGPSEFRAISISISAG